MNRRDDDPADPVDRAVDEFRLVGTVGIGGAFAVGGG